MELDIPRRDSRANSDAYLRLDAIQRAIVELKEAYDDLASPEVLNEKIEERHRLLPNADSLDLEELARAPLEERRRHAEILFKRALDSYSSKANANLDNSQH